MLTQDQVLALIKAEPDLMMRTIFITIYAAGLRISEVIRLTTGDINGERMVIHVRQAKGHKDRYVMLSDKHLAILRSYWKRRQPEGDLLFPGPLLNRPITRVPCNRVSATPFEKAVCVSAFDAWRRRNLRIVQRIRNDSVKPFPALATDCMLKGRKKELWDKADAERQRCRRWLLYYMRPGQPKRVTKAALRDAAMRELKITKNSFDSAWIAAIEDAGRHDWYEPIGRQLRTRQ